MISCRYLDFFFPKQPEASSSSPVDVHKAEWAADFLGQHRPCFFSDTNLLWTSIQMMDRPGTHSYHKLQRSWTNSVSFCINKYYQRNASYLSYSCHQDSKRKMLFLCCKVVFSMNFISCCSLVGSTYRCCKSGSLVFMSQHPSCISVTAYGYAAIFLNRKWNSALVLSFLSPLHPSGPAVCTELL